MAAFVIGKSLKDRRHNKALSELFNRADKNGNGRMTVQELQSLLKETGMTLQEEEVSRISSLANSVGEVSKEDFVHFAKHSESLQSQMDKKFWESIAFNQESLSKAERAFKLFDKDSDGFISKEEFQGISRKLSRTQIDGIFGKFDSNKDGFLSLEEFKKMLNK